MAFATDRDLLIAEPNVFRDLPMLSQQRLVTDDAHVTGVTLTSPTADFAEARVDAGGVVVLDGTAIEVVQRIDANTLSVSMIRGVNDALAIPPGDRVGATVQARTFEPQIERIHRELLERIGIGTGGEQRETSWTIDMIVSVDRMVELETLGTLSRIYVMAQAMTGDNGPLCNRANHYQRRFDQLMQRTHIRLDPGGDGRVDLTVPLGRVRLQRV